MTSVFQQAAIGKRVCKRAPKAGLNESCILPTSGRKSVQMRLGCIFRRARTVNKIHLIGDRFVEQGGDELLPVASDDTENNHSILKTNTK